MRTNLLAGLGVAAVALSAALFLGQNTIKPWLFSQAMPSDYFAHFDYIKPTLYRVAGPVYAFEKGFTRSLVLRTPEGVAVFDTFSSKHTSAMVDAIAKAFPGEKIRWVVLSHNHLDHVRGSVAIAGAEVIGHAEVNTLVADWKDIATDAAPVTRIIAGDQTLVFGGIEVQALYMPFSHSHTLYGFHVPSAGVVFAPDMMFVKMVPPFDFPDHYYPGYIRALDRLIALNAAHYVPSHGDRGDHAALVAFRNMTVDFQAAVREEFLTRGVEVAVDGANSREALRAVYAKLQPKYGDWHGFDAMFVPKFGRHFGGSYLGY
ncbi:MAG: MBL fold metallo-hydrolase [Alphaproteobacteria bacterium]|nr:MBL fold metallo-hydrolase [Alphaproteobacteria bacterium]